MFLSSYRYMCLKSQSVHTIYYTNSYTSHRIVIGHLLTKRRKSLLLENNRHFRKFRAQLSTGVDKN